MEGSNEESDGNRFTFLKGHESSWARDNPVVGIWGGGGWQEQDHEAMIIVQASLCGGLGRGGGHGSGVKSQDLFGR